MNLLDRFVECVKASCSAIWLKSENFVDAEAILLQACQTSQVDASAPWHMAVWDAHQGMRWATTDKEGRTLPNPTSPHLAAALDTVIKFGHNDDPGSTILVLRNPQKELKHPVLLAQLSNLVAYGRAQRIVIAILTAERLNEAEFPDELSRQFVTIRHELPNSEALWEVAKAVAGEEIDKTDTQQRQRLLEASLGLTHLEAEMAYAVSIVRHGQLEPDAIWEQKTQLLETAAALELYNGNETFADLVGLEGLKSFCLQLINSPQRSANLRPLGVLLVGPAGAGKSAFCKALGNEVHRKTIALSVSRLRNKFQGETEARTERALEVVDAMGTSVLFIDEIEKAFAGAESSGATDGGAGMRLLGTWLTWMNDRQSDTFIVASANEVQDLPAPFTRAERFDAIFFVDLPNEDERRAIWQYYRKYYELGTLATVSSKSAKMTATGEQLLLQQSQNWTGAEIKACCRQSKLRDVDLLAAAASVVPVAVRDATRLESLRSWANDRCLSASTGNVYRSREEGRGDSGPSRRRQVSNN